jgi:hypothetical protein
VVYEAASKSSGPSGTVVLKDTLYISKRFRKSLKTEIFIDDLTEAFPKLG